MTTELKKFVGRWVWEIRDHPIGKGVKHGCWRFTTFPKEENNSCHLMQNKHTKEYNLVTVQSNMWMAGCKILTLGDLENDYTYVVKIINHE